MDRILSTMPIDSRNSCASALFFSGEKAQVLLITADSFGFPFEFMTEIGMEVKKQSPYSGTMIITHCNESSGYI